VAVAVRANGKRGGLAEEGVASGDDAVVGYGVIVNRNVGVRGGGAWTGRGGAMSVGDGVACVDGCVSVLSEIQAGRLLPRDIMRRWVTGS
jgi:hypothetical protein